MTLFIGLVAVFGLFAAQGSMAQLLNLHGAVIVFGGTVCVFLIMTPVSSMKHLLRLCLAIHREDPGISKEDLTRLMKNRNAAVTDPYGLVEQARDLWELGTDDAEFEELISSQAESILNQNMAVISILRNIGKYPPALGMVGTVMGMIRLFSGLGGGTNQVQIGMQLALAMTATFYGLILSNFLFLPLADRLEVKEERRRGNLERAVKMLMAIQKRQPSPVSERILHAS
jgi:chemotaxis protein MotA